MNMAPNTLNLILSDVMAACVDAYGQTGAPDSPARRFIPHGQPVVEGEQLTVASLGISATHPFPLAQLRAIKSTVVGSAGVSIEVWRSCWPVPNISSGSKNMVDPAGFTKASQALALDAVTLWGHLAQLCASGGLLPSLPSIDVASDTSMSPMVPLGPTGQLAGWKLNLAVKLSVVSA